MRAIPLVAAVMVAVLCGGCKDMLKGHEQGAMGVEDFHKLYNAEKYAEIFTSADPDFGKSVTLPDFKKFLDAVHRKLGPVTGSTEDGWRINSLNGKTYVSLSQKTEFEKGVAVESFTFVMHDGQALLYNYNVNSRALIEN
ncbi:MAG: hypothetical protein BGO12_21975 [Verrucomicrobia bacterium 61-8]|nr:hypothetical protein [Verrucomicrobiota bacterium]OJV05487.1 MAG: hypothetical protein BGO12_21975 [Verrucomicrobia bacterium 61-8]